MKFKAILLAAGKGQRFGEPKQFAALDGHPLFMHSLRRFCQSTFFEKIYLVLPQKDSVPNLGALNLWENKITLVQGGPTRAESVLNALTQISPTNDTVVLIHDTARPLIPSKLIDEICRQMEVFDALSPTIAIADAMVHKDTFKSLDRNEIVALQTPQGFRLATLLEAFTRFQKTTEKFPNSEFELVRQKVPEAKVGLVEGHPFNRKVTTPEDLVLLQCLIQKLKDDF